MHMFYLLFLGDFIEGLLLKNINSRIEGEKVSYWGGLVSIGVYIMMDTIKYSCVRYFCLGGG